MCYKQVAKDTAKVLESYLTYQAVKVIINQLSETNPGEAIWLNEYSSGQKLQDSKVYLEGLIKENKELMLRILTVREDLAIGVLEFLPEMVSTEISKSNMEHRCNILERLTQTQSSTLNMSPDEILKSDTDSNQSID